MTINVAIQNLFGMCSNFVVLIKFWFNGKYTTLITKRKKVTNPRRCKFYRVIKNVVFRKNKCTLSLVYYCHFLIKVHSNFLSEFKKHGEFGLIILIRLDSTLDVCAILYINFTNKTHLMMLSWVVIYSLCSTCLRSPVRIFVLTLTYYYYI